MDREKKLREIAEKISNLSGIEKNYTQNEISELMEELNIHQIELEIQNEELKKSRQIIENNRNKYRDLYNLAPVGYFLINKNLLIKEVNNTAAEILGYPQLSLQEKPISLFIANRAFVEFHDYREKVLYSGLKHDKEILMKRKNGEEFTALITSKPVPNNEGSIYLAIIDINQNIKNEREVRKFRRAIEQSPTMIMITDTAGIAEYANPQTCKITGYSIDEISGKNPRIFKTPYHDENFYRRLWETISEGYVWEGEFYNRKKDGKCFWEKAKIAPVFDEDGEICNYIKISEDLSEEKKIKEELVKSKEQLEKYNHDLEESNRKFELINRKYITEIEKASRLHTRFMPKNLPEIGDFNFASYYKPAINLGGDFYNFIEIKDKLIVYLVDISGHGFDGAIMNIFIRETINSYFMLHANKEFDIREVLEFVYEKYKLEQFPQEYFICMLLGIIDKNSSRFTFTNCGIQVPPIFMERNGEVSLLDEAWLPMSSLIESSYFRKRNLPITSIELQEGSTLLIATDGLIEEKVGKQIYGIDRLKNIIKENYYLNANRIINRINEDFRKRSGSLQGSDDVTFIIIQREIKWEKTEKYTIKSNLSEIDAIKEKFRDFLAELEIDKIEMLLGFHEILINAIEHGNSFDESKKIKVSFKKSYDRIYIGVEDEGRGFDWEEKLKQKPESIICMQDKNSFERGRGICIALISFDDLYYNQKGNKASLIKLLSEEVNDYEEN
ncbi:MAG: PAS domain S-box protein [Bacillota bacterium]